jgi:hypothetical protein
MKLDKLLRPGLQYLKWHHLFPHNRWGDAWHARLHCLRYNGHWPRAVGGGINDFLAFLKGSPEIDHPFRRLSSDKYLLKQWLDEYLGPGWSVPTWGYLTSDREIEGFEFQSRCVIKPTHLSGEIIFRSNGEAINLDLIKAWLRQNHYRKTRERNYRGVRPGVLVEPWLKLDQGGEPKVYALRGEPKVLVLHPQGHRLCVDIRGQSMGFGMAGWGRKMGLAQPEELPRLQQILEATRRISAELLFCRVDFLDTPAGLMVGEVTHLPMNGLAIFFPEEGEEKFARHFFGPAGFCLADFPEVRPAAAIWN